MSVASRPEQQPSTSFLRSILEFLVGLAIVAFIVSVGRTLVDSAPVKRPGRVRATTAGAPPVVLSTPATPEPVAPVPETVEPSVGPPTDIPSVASPPEGISGSWTATIRRASDGAFVGTDHLEIEQAGQAVLVSCRHVRADGKQCTVWNGLGRTDGDAVTYEAKDVKQYCGGDTDLFKHVLTISPDRSRLTGRWVMLDNPDASGPIEFSRAR